MTTETIHRYGVEWTLHHSEDSYRDAECIHDPSAVREYVDEYVTDPELAAELLATIKSGDMRPWELMFDYGDLA